MKKILLIALVTTLLLLTACAFAEPINVYALKGPTGIGLSYVMDDTMCSVMDYFEIFTQRMLMCRRAAQILSCRFRMTANGSKVL